MNKCIVCGKKFKSDKWHPRQVTCSVWCNAKKQQTKGRAKRKSLRPETKHCTKCGKKYIPNKFAWRVSKYCVECRKIALHENAKRYRWKNPRLPGYHYRTKWNGNWLRAMERDKEICQVCGKKASKETLLVHHLDGSGETGNPNHKLDNLQVQCFSCHSKIHKFSFLMTEDTIYLNSLLFELYPNHKIVGRYTKK